MMLHLFDTDGQNRRYFTVLSDCTVGEEKKPQEVLSEWISARITVAPYIFNNVITGTPTSVALPEHRLFHVFKKEGERREQRGTCARKDTGQWKSVNRLNHCLFKKSCQMTECAVLFF